MATTEDMAMVKTLADDVRAELRELVERFVASESGPERDAMIRRYRRLCEDLEALVDRHHALAMSA